MTRDVGHARAMSASDRVCADIAIDADGGAATRFVAMDALRGAALFGILLMNVEYFSRPLQGLMLGTDDSLRGVDAAVAWVVTAFVQGKFWFLFSLLFGAGFALLQARARASGEAFFAMYARRLIGLLCFGIAHAWLLWAGDVLVMYAIGGAALLLCFRYTAPSLFWWLGTLMYLLPLVWLWTYVAGGALLSLFPSAAGLLDTAMAAEAARMQHGFDVAAGTYRDASWLDVTKQRIADTWMLWSALPTQLPSVVGVFLLGAALHHAGVLSSPSMHRRLLVRLLAVGGPLGAAFAVLAMWLIDGNSAYVIDARVALGQSLMLVASGLLAFAYLAAMLLALPRLGGRLVQALAAAGRMSLSNYLIQSAVFTSLFYGYGLGAWGEVSRLQQIALACCVFAVQLLASGWWLRHVGLGPVDWLLRALTGWRVPPLRAR